MKAALVPLLGAPAFIMDGVYVGATWTRDMRNLMAAALAAYLGAWWALQAFGNTGLWLALLIFYVFRGGLQILRYRSLAHQPWPPRCARKRRQPGQLPAVMSAASMPTIAASVSRLPRLMAAAMSAFICATRPMP